ncbi:MAG TPA: RDD family protein [Pseudolabrys sp.]|nr:RDD family protein [Pseudolabrys sp.]
MSLETDAQTPAYARFTRRVQGFYVDLIILMLIMTATLIVAVAFRSDNVGRVLGFTAVITLLLYEPLLVSLTGSTLGHRYCNIRVVDDRHGGNIGYAKAVSRVIIKVVLGWYSFILMAATSRHQALHDLLTRSTVQIGDLARAKPHHFAQARTPLPEGTPSRSRRIVVIVGYLTMWAILAGVVLVNTLSKRCLTYYACSGAEHAFEIIFNLGWLVGCAALVGLGWRGRLWGARACT